MAKKSLLDRIRGLFGGKSQKKTPPKTRTTSKSNVPEPRVYNTVNRRAFLNTVTGKDEPATRYKSMADATKSDKASLDPKRAAALKSQENAKANLNKAKTAVKDWNDSNKQQSKEFHERTNHKYDVDYWEKKGDKAKAQEARIRVKSGENSADAVAEELAVKYHPIAYSATRGAASGVTFGATDLMLSRRTGEGAEREKYYQEHKNKAAETVGEFAGSFASFGGTAGATEKLGAKVMSKAAPKAVEKLAEKKVVQGLAKRGVNKAVKKGLIGEASEELIKQAGKEKAQKIVSAIGTDIVQNLTTGAIYDINKASARHEVGSENWWKELGTSAAFNAVITGGIAGGTTLGLFGGNKRVALETARKLAQENGIGEEATKKVLRNSLTVKGKAKPLVGNADEVTEAVAKNADETVEATAKGANPTEENLENFNINEEAPREDIQRTINETVEKEGKKAQAKADEQKINLLTEVQAKREKQLDAAIREKSGGKYGYRQGEHLSTKNASIDEAMRIEHAQKEIYEQTKSDNIKSLFVDENKPFAVFKTATKEDMMDAAAQSAKNVSTDLEGTVNRLLDLDKRLIKDAEVSPLMSNEHISFGDICDITAVRKAFEAADTKLPPEYEQAFTHILEWQGTEGAQMLKMRDLFLKENDAGFRRMLISRDVENYLRKVLNADDKGIAEIKRSLDMNYGEGYFDNMLEELSKYSGMDKEAAFRKAYADFQKVLIENAKPTGWDIVNTIRHTLMLAAPKTWGNNGLGNINQRIMYDIADMMNSPLERLAQTINPDVKRTTAVLKSKDQLRLANMITSGKVGEHNIKNADYLKGFKDQSFANTINDASLADVGDMMESSKYMGEIVRGANFKGIKLTDKAKRIAAKGTGFGQKFVSLMLNEPDSWFVERNYRSTLLKYLEANGVNSSEALATKEGQKIFKEARDYAKDVALENTYKKSNELVSFLEGLRKKGYVKGSNPLYKTITLTLDAELPYLKVPVNLVINNFKYSPMGLTKGTYDALRAISKGDAELLNKATRELSKGLTGTGLMYLGYLMRCRNQADNDSVGLIANAEDELKEYGIKDNSFKIGNHVFNVANLGIGSTQLLMGSALGEDLDKEGAVPTYQVVLDSMAKTLDVEADMSLMENAMGLLDLFGNGGNYDMKLSERLGRAGTEIAGDYAGQFILNPLGGFAKGITDADLDTGVKKGDTTQTERIIKRNINNVVSRVPVLNEKVLPHKVDTHGRLVNERTTTKDKTLAVLNNTLNPLTHTKVNIPEADRIEMSVKDEDGNAYKTKGFDPNRKYQAQIGSGSDTKEIIDLTGKEREQVARSATRAGYDGMQNLVNKGVFGDRLGERAQEILSRTPENDEEARELFFSTPEWKNATNEQRQKYLDWYYGVGAHGKGVDRTRSREAYVNIAGNSEDDFRWQNDITPTNQKKYNDYGLAEIGISKGAWVDILEACADTNHKWNEETQKNQDTINSAKKTKNGILAVEGLTPEQRIAAYNVIRGKRTGFGWNDWDGVTGGGSGSGYGYGGYRRSGGRKAKVPKINAKSMAAATRSSKGTTVKLEPPKPKDIKVTTKFKDYDI